jgi:alanyl-tRNA synthetase
VAIRFASAEEARMLPLRKESARGGQLRIVDVPGFDLSACGGTHVARTGVIGVIAALGTEKFKGGVRVTFVCGGRAVRALRQLRDAVSGAVRALSVLPEELPAAIEKLQQDGKAFRKAIAGLQETLAGHEAERLLAEASADSRRVVVHTYVGWDVNGLKTIASSLITRAPVAVALVASGEPASIVVGTAPSLGLDAGAIVRQIADRFGGRGGGRADLAQAGGLTGDPAAIAAAVRALLPP